MATNTEQGTHYGNLLSYKYYMRPTAQKQYGSSNITDVKHHENVQKLLQVLALNGTCTTWDMAKYNFPNDHLRIRTKEKEFRRLLVGRTDRGRHSSGILEFGLVVKDGKKYRQPVSDKYRLSLHGLLYCLDILNLSKKDIDKIALNYSSILPRVFGKWEYLKKSLGDDVYKIQILARGLLLDNPEIVHNPYNPLYELMSYIHIKFRRNFEFISENDLADQISLWFYTYQLYDSDYDKKGIPPSIKKLKNLIQNNKDLQKWYTHFVKDANNYYTKRVSTIKKSGLL